MLLLSFSRHPGAAFAKDRSFAKPIAFPTRIAAAYLTRLMRLATFTSACKRAEAFFRRTDLPPSKCSVSFQSRLGRKPWLRPYTDLELARFAREGANKILVACPAFVADCLETLEEIGIRGKEIFENAGGESLTLLPLPQRSSFLDSLPRK